MMLQIIPPKSYQQKIVNKLQTKRWYPIPKSPPSDLYNRRGGKTKSTHFYQMGVSENYGYPLIIHFNRVFHCKPSILRYHYFWKHPNEAWSCEPPRSLSIDFDFQGSGGWDDFFFKGNFHWDDHIFRKNAPHSTSWSISTTTKSEKVNVRCWNNWIIKNAY